MREGNFTPMQTLLTRTRRPDITFHRSGIISITARVGGMLGLHEGDSINIAVSGGEYFLFAVRHCIGRHEAQCFPTKRGGRNLRANSARLCRLLLDSIGLSGCPRASFMAGEKVERDGTTFLPIITQNPILC